MKNSKRAACRCLAQRREGGLWSETAGGKGILLPAGSAHGGHPRDAGAAGGSVRATGADHRRRDEQEIIELANATDFGLGASIWSRNSGRAEELSRHIKAGFIAINNIVKSDPRLPFGGVKKSGVGRELSHYGLLEFVNVKTVVVGQAAMSDASDE